MRMEMNKNITIRYIRLLIVVPVLFYIYEVNGQGLNIKHELFHIYDHQPVKKTYAFARQNQNEIEMILSGMFLFYKRFISSQDAQHCGFTPSCSEFALRSIQKKGVFIGTLMGFDRLARCNGLSPENYTRDLHSHLLIDPVE